MERGRERQDGEKTRKKERVTDEERKDKVLKENADNDSRLVSLS